MKVSISQISKYIVFTALGVALLYVVFKDVNLQVLWNDIKKANFWWLLPALFFAVVGYISRAYRWNLLIKPLGYSPSLANSSWALMFGYFANLALPRIGEVARCGALNKTANIPVDKLIGTVIVERIFDLLMLLILSIITFFIKIDFFGKFIIQEILNPTYLAFRSINGYIAVALCVVLAFLFAFIFATRKKNSLVIKVVAFMGGIVQGVKSVYFMKNRLAFFAHTIIIWTMYWAMTWVICFTIPQTSHLDAADALFLLIVGGVGMSVPVQSGMGAFHFIVAQALTIYGLDFKTEGLLYATISHESQMLLVIVLGIASVYFLFLKNKLKA